MVLNAAESFELRNTQRTAMRTQGEEFHGFDQLTIQRIRICAAEPA
jgi:hypothetical protein